MKKNIIYNKLKIPRRKYRVEYLDGTVEEAIGDIIAPLVDGKRRFFFDKWEDGMPPRWIARFNEYFNSHRTTSEAYQFAESHNAEMREFKKYWALDNLPEITKKYYFVRGPNDPPTKRGRKMFEK